MSKNNERLQIRAKSFKKYLKGCFFGKVSGPQSATLLKDKLHYHFFQFICLLFKTQLLIKENFKQKSKNFEMQCILCCTRCIALHFQLMQLVFLTDPWSTFAKQGWITWMDSTCFQVRSIKKKGKHGKYSVGVHNVKYSIWKVYGNYNMSLLMLE